MLAKLGKKKEIMLVAIIFLILLAGVGGFFLLKQHKGEEKTALGSEWDISWYDENEEEFIITTKEELLGFADLSQTIDFAGKTVKLGNDIVINDGNAAKWETKAPAISWIPILKFAGTFDGQGKSISGLYANITSGGAGMFAETQESSVIRDFRLVNSYIYSQSSKGTGSISSGGNGKLEYIYTDAIVNCNGFYCGGIVGNLKDGASVNECWFDGKITVGGSCAGGIAASANNGHSKMTHCLNTGTVTSTYLGPDPAIIGGILGAVTKKIDISDTLNVGAVSSEAGLEQVGGLIGMISGGTVKVDALWTANDIAPDRVGYAKSGFDGAYGDCRLDQMIGVMAYQKMNLDFDKHWTIVEESTPILQYFAEKVTEIPEGLERAYFADISWYNIKYNEFIISTPEELLGLARLTEMGEGYGNRFTNKTVKLANDIVFNTAKASTYEKEEPLNEWIPIYNFTGTFDGQGHTISGLYAVGSETEKMATGFFSYSREMTVIENLKITNSYFSTKNVYGLSAVAGRGGGTIRNVYADAILKATDMGNIGGIFGFATRTPVHIENCWSDCDITTGARRVGGILGNGNGRTDVEIKHCLNTGTLTRSFKGLAADDNNRKLSSLFGGIVGGTGGGNKEKGYTGEFLIEDCFNAGVVKSEKDPDGLGGIIGTATGNQADGTPTVTVKNCYCTASSCAKAIGAQNSQAIVLDVARIEDEMVTGAEAYFYTSLNFKQYWAALEEKTPVLKTFASGKGKTLAVGGERVDTSWFQAGKTEFVIKNKSQLYGFMMLSYGGQKFNNMTVKLGADIVANEGNASDWANGTAKAARTWETIYNFMGTFDGQGYTISGLYGYATGVHEERGGIGMFVESRTESKIQNFSLRNSYFESTYANGVGAVSGRGGGTFKNIYVGSDVYLQNKLCGSVGAIVGITTRDTTIENCWSAATIKVAGPGVGGIVGNGNSQKVTIKHCLNTGNITRSFDGHEEALKLYDYAQYPSYYKDRTEYAAYFGGIIGKTGGGKKGAYTGTFVIEDCLSVGTISSEREKDSTGGVAAQTTGNKEDGTPTVTIINSYSNESSCTKAIASQNSETKISDCVRLNDNMLIGTEAYYFTLLDFGNYWAATQSGTPILKSFKSASDQVVAVSGKRADTSWYTNGDSIKDAEDLYGLMKLSLQGRTFSKETIKLGANFEVNTGNAADWSKGQNVPGRNWTPIRNFAGVFDGQGFTISGLYGYATGVHADRDGMGLFVESKDTATIQNFNIANSYFGTTYANGVAVVAGRGGGTFKNIHILGDVYVANKISGSAGAIVGMATKKTTVENCWSEAYVTAPGQRVAGIIGNGNSQTVTIKHCLNTGNITRSFAGLTEALKLYDYADYTSYYKDTSASAGYFGGIIGGTGSGSTSAGYKGSFVVEDCVSVGTITSEREDDANGGIAGHTTGLTSDDKVTVTITNAYCNESSCAKVIGSKNSKTKVSHCTRLADDKLIGINAFYNTELDYKSTTNTDGYWSARENAYPILYTYLVESDVTIDVSGLLKDEFVLVNNQGYITTLNQLESFRDQMNDGSLTVNSDTVITLLSDIVVNEGKATDWAAGKNVPTAWTPINGYSGTFDGAGHTISGLFVNGADGLTGRGLFTMTNGATIKDLKVTNSFYKGNTSTGTGAIVGQGNGTFVNIYTDVIMIDTAKGALGGIIGTVNGHTTVRNCWTASDITSAKNYVGGIFGTITKTGFNITIEDCLNTGNLTYTGSSNSYFGGLVGRANVNSPTGGCLKVTDCLNLGIVSGTTKQAYMGGLLGFASKVVNQNETTIITDSYSAVYDTGIDKVIGTDQRTNKTGASTVDYSKLIGNLALANTTLDYKNDTNTDGYWVVREDKTPMLSYFLEMSNILDAEEEANSTFVLKDNAGTISNEKQLQSFRDQMNDGSLTVNSETLITLTDDVVLNVGWTASATAPGIVWTPIVGYPGTFDGAGYSISGVYTKSIGGISGIGIFTGTTETTVIKNLNIANSYFRGNSSAGTSALVGKGCGTFENIYVEATLFDKDTKGNMGGIVGYVTGEVSVSNCWSNCQMEANAPYLGGIVGNANAKKVTIKHCFNESNITMSSTATASNGYVGGIIGKTGAGSGSASSPYSGNVYIEDCLSVGIIKTLSTKTTKAFGGLVGYATGKTNADKATVTIKNSYCAVRDDGTTVAVGVDKGASKENVMAVEYDKLKGESALINASLLVYKNDTNKNGYWITRENNVPILVVFGSK